MLFGLKYSKVVKIMVVSGTRNNIKEISNRLDDLSQTVSLLAASSANEAANICSNNELDLIIVAADSLSRGNVMSFCQELPEVAPGVLIPVIVILNSITAGVKVEFINNGVDSILQKPVPRQVFISIVNKHLKYKLFHDELEHIGNVLIGFVKALEVNNPYTGGHSKRVAKFSLIIAKEFGFSEIELNTLYAGALLHDIGKIGIIDKIINKPGKLTEEEMDMVRKHPLIATRILKNLSSLEPVIDIIRHHHERYDGQGYPDGLKGEKLTLNERIIGLADGIDAMLSDRPYRQGMSVSKIENILRENSDKQWDGRIVNIVLEKGIVEKAHQLLKDEKTNLSLTSITNYSEFQEIVKKI